MKSKTRIVKSDNSFAIVNNPFVWIFPFLIIPQLIMRGTDGYPFTENPLFWMVIVGLIVSIILSISVRRQISHKDPDIIKKSTKNINMDEITGVEQDLSTVKSFDELIAKANDLLKKVRTKLKNLEKFGDLKDEYIELLNKEIHLTLLVIQAKQLRKEENEWSLKHWVILIIGITLVALLFGC